MLVESGIQPDGLFARVFIDDQLIPQARWEMARPVAGQLVTVRVIPTGGGGGKDGLRIIAMLAVAALALAAPYLAPVGWGLVGAWTGAALSATVAIAGSLAVNALIPPAKPKMQDLSRLNLSPTLSLTGTSNQLAPYAPIPRVYGRHRIFPQYAARPFTEMVGNDQYLRLLFCCGYGPLALSELKIGQTPIEHFTDVTMEIRYGFADDEPITLFPDDVYEDPLSIVLTPEAGAQQRTTQPNAREIGLEWFFPGGLATYFTEARSDGDNSVTFAVEYRQVGDTAWTNLDLSEPAVTASLETAFAGTNNDIRFEAVTAGALGNSFRITMQEYPDLLAVIGNVGGAYGAVHIYYPPGASAGTVIAAVNAAGVGLVASNVAGNDGTGQVSDFSGQLSGGRNVYNPLTVTANTREPFRYPFTFFVPTPGEQYDVRVSVAKLAGETALVRTDAVLWSMLRTIQTTEPVSKPGLCLVALRIKATDQLNGTVDQFSCVAESILPDWNGTAWIERPTRNPASIYRNILQGSANARPLADSRLDLTTLQAFHERCDAHGFTFNAVIDFRTTVFELARDVLAAGRASFGLRDGKYSVIEDLAQSEPVQHFTPRNSWGFRGSKVFVDLPHALKVRFVNPDKDWQQDERFVYADGYDESNATQFESFELTGVTDAEQAWKLGRYHLAVAQLRPETYEIQTDVENLVCTRGDLVRVVHDVPLFGAGYGRIKDVTLDSSGNLTALTLDESITLDGALSYAIRIRKKDGTSVVQQIATVAGAQTAFTFTAPVTVTRPAAKDSSGNGLDGTYVGGPVLGVAGLLDVDPGSAVSFTGPNGDHLTVGSADTTELDIQPAMSIELLIEMPSFALDAATTQRICGKRLDANNRWSVNVNQNGQVGIGIAYGGASYTAIQFPSAMSLNTRTHVVITFNSATPLVYIDGLAVATVANGAGIIGLTTFTVGRFSASSGRFTGTLAHLAKYNTVLSPARVAAHAAAVLAGGYREEVLADNPVLYLKLGEQMTPGIGDLALLGVHGEESVEMLVQSIQPGPDLTATLTLVDAAPAVLTADSGTIPAFDSQITLPAAGVSYLPIPQIDSVLSDETVLVRDIDGSYQSRILISLSFLSGVRQAVAHIEAQYRKTDSNAPWTQLRSPVSGTAIAVSIAPVEDGQAYDLRLRTVSAIGQTSDWVTIDGHTVIGKTTPPPDVLAFLRDGDQLFWTYPDPPLDFAGFALRRHYGTRTNWADAQPLHDGVITGTRYDLTGDVSTITYLLKAVDVAGNESTNAIALTINLGELLVDNILFTSDKQADGWPGTHNGIESGGNLTANTASIFWSGGDSAPMYRDDADLFWVAQYDALEYVTSLMPDADKVPCTLVLDLTVAAQWYQIEFRTSGEGLFWSGVDATAFWSGTDADAFWSESSQEWMPWLGRLENATRQVYEWRLTTGAGPVQGVLSQYLIKVDVPDIREYIDDVTVSALGTTRLPLARSYRAITNVRLTVQNNGGTAIAARVKDKGTGGPPLTGGPNIECLDAAGAVVAGLVDAEVQGY